MIENIFDAHHINFFWYFVDFLFFWARDLLGFFISSWQFVFIKVSGFRSYVFSIQLK